MNSRPIITFVLRTAPALLAAWLSGCSASRDAQPGRPASRAALRQSGSGTLVLHERSADFAAGAFTHAALACCGGQGVLLLGANQNPGVYESPVVNCARPFNEALLSWNIWYPAGAGGFVEFRVGRGADGSWSPWLYVGDWGAHRPPEDRTMVFDGGEIEVDYFRSTQRYDRAQYRVSGLAPRGAAPPAIRRIALCLSDESAAAPARRGSTDAPPRQLRVPFRAQRSDDPTLAGRLCSPASLAMVLDYRGASRPTGEVARLCWDATNDIYGNWPRNIQAAFEVGVPGYLMRFSDWDAVRRCIEADQPLIISIRVERPGALRGAPYRVTDGHLIVLTGFAADGDVLVNDPAGATPQTGQLRYRRDDLERCWLEAGGGVAYVLERPG